MVELVLDEEGFQAKTETERGKTDRYPVAGVIGHTPVRQYLVEMPGNRLQALSIGYAPEDDRWVDLFAGENRTPGDWGHWTGQGMNWNANCAWCHTTGYRKNFDFKANRYDSTWDAHGITCASCHGNLAKHIASARSVEKPVVLPDAISPEQQIDNCAACHSRRDQLTADKFVSGDRFDNHFSLSLPDQPGLYYPDGQIRDEVFVYGSFAMSRMHRAGVTCLDCHKPHSLETRLPADDNSLCLSCHGSGTRGAPVINPTVHSHHVSDSPGNRCVNCHMAETTYMAVDNRADHGFLLPDPLLTREQGIPNACGNCHSDNPLDWLVSRADERHGQALSDSRQRRRARTIGAAYQLQPNAVDGLLSLLSGEEIPAWRAVYVGLLANYRSEPKAMAAIRNGAGDESPLVRARAAFGLHGTGAVLPLLKDTSLSVRLAAAQGEPFADQSARRELQEYLIFHRDRPQNLLMLASLTDPGAAPDEIHHYVKRAIELDSKNPELYHQGAVALSSAGLNRAADTLLSTASERFPARAVFPYSRALIAAEAGNYQSAIEQLEKAVALEPDFPRAWYNLSLAYSHTGQTEKANQAMARARSGASSTTPKPRAPLERTKE
ncbi:MAG: hypothetical protein CMK32_15545 [Porticoccaceae bacterium]|nr:hypothetical protein [Porticoccaceae bacterium]